MRDVVCLADRFVERMFAKEVADRQFAHRYDEPRANQFQLVLEPAAARVQLAATRYPVSASGCAPGKHRVIAEM